jgi:hypothetical protein
MSSRTGIDLHANLCRIVDVQVRRARSTDPVGVRVRAFDTLSCGSESPTLAAELKRARHEQRLSRKAWVTLWGLQSVHQFLRLPPARDADLEALAIREARADLAPLQTGGDRLSVTVMAGPDVHVGTHRRREVSLVAAGEAEISRRIKPLLDAGFDVQGVSTPALALVSVAGEQTGVAPGTTTVYVALEASATCVAIIRGGVLLFSREIPWGFADSREPIAERLSSELRRSMLFFRQTFRTAVDVVVLCGGMTGLRSLTAPVGSALGVPVQTLDSLSGLDAGSIPEPADTFRATVAELWPAIATAAGPESRASLLPASVRTMRRQRKEIAGIAAALVAAALVIAVWSGLTRWANPSQASQITAVEQRVALLAPEAERSAAARRASSLAASRQAALDAFNSQGPRLARMLEVLSRSTPPEVVLNEIDVQADLANWRTLLGGMAIADDPAASQGAVAVLLQRVSLSPFVGTPAQPPVFRLMSGRGGFDAEESSPPRSIPDGATGVEFRARFRVNK